MSINMIEHSLAYLREHSKTFPYKNILPIEMDISKEHMLRDLRKVLERIIPNKDKILFSIIGNTLANFKDDKSMLKGISDILLDTNDVLLTELSFVNHVDEQIKKGAEREYSCGSFKKFATGSLVQNTNIDASQEKNYHVVVKDMNEENQVSGCIIECRYFNNVNIKNNEFSILQDTPIPFPKGKSILLYLSRKYTNHGINTLIRKGNLKQIAVEHVHHRQFGSVLLLLEKSTNQATKEKSPTI
jgi:L-histidine Nalpha-methyltransferase